MISLSTSLTAISRVFSTSTLTALVFVQTAFAQSATEPAPSATPAPSGAAAVDAAPSAPTAPLQPAAPATPPAESVSPDSAAPMVAPDTAADAASIPASMLPHDLTPWGMFMQADIVVKAVMVGLAFASLVTWTVWLAKSFEIRFEKRRARKKNRWLEHAKSLDDAVHQFAKDKDPVARLVRAAAHEVELSHGLAVEGVKERIILQLERIEASASRRIGNGMGVLATIGATSPFVGLFGTVWGIMNSFIGISKSHTTSLAVVAPGIAEALLATALGLVAAIPAVVIYNMFTRSIGGYRLILGNASANVLRLASRDLDRGSMKLRHPAQQAAE